MSKDKILILDADSLIYIAGNKNSIEEAIQSLEYKLMGIQEETKCNKVLGFLTSGKCFRYNIDPFYKHKRVLLEKPKFYNTLKNYLIETKEFITDKNLEADDLVSITRTVLYSLGIKNVIASTDKDVLHQIPGENFDYYISKDTNTFRGFLNTTKEDSMRFLFKQCLMGDSIDGIEGIKGIGLSKSEQILNTVGDEDFNNSLFDRYFKKTLNVYKEYYKNDILALKHLNKTLRLVYILRNEEEINQECDSKEFKYKLDYIIKKLNL